MRFILMFACLVNVFALCAMQNSILPQRTNSATTSQDWENIDIDTHDERLVNAIKQAAVDLEKNLSTKIDELKKVQSETQQRQGGIALIIRRTWNNPLSFHMPSFGVGVITAVLMSYVWAQKSSGN